MNKTFGAALTSTCVYTPHALSALSYSWYSYLTTATATGSITESTAQDEKVDQQVN